ncbi:four helix bundle protein [Candidatus Nomurabacteria bacterium]|nr:four helix bundle protein [Candidatus Nomurabacteria bacterium]
MSNDFSEKLIIRSKKVAVEVITYIRRLPKDNVNYVISNQIIRSVLSVGANITEGQGGSSKRDFVNFLRYALKSANETIYWLQIVGLVSTVDGKQIKYLEEELIEIAKILGASISTISKDLGR